MARPLLSPTDDRITETVKRRFWSRVTKPAGEEGCWLWTGAKVGKSGYGRAYLDDMQKVYAHRLSHLLHGGEFTPEAPDALHACDNPPCVNPAHLRAGDKIQNAADMVARGRALTGDRAPFRVHPKSCPRGERHSRAIVTELEVRDIRVAWAAGATVKDLAEQYSMSWYGMNAIVTRKNWKHVNENEPIKPPRKVYDGPKLKRYNPLVKRVSESDRAKIYKYHAAGFTMITISHLLQYSTATISRILKTKPHRPTPPAPEP